MSATVLPFKAHAAGERSDKPAKTRERAGSPRPIHLPAPPSQVYRDDAPPPGLDIHRGQTDEGRFICTVATVAGEIDGLFLMAIMDFVARVNARRGPAIHLEEP